MVNLFGETIKQQLLYNSTNDNDDFNLLNEMSEDEEENNEKKEEIELFQSKFKKK